MSLKHNLLQRLYSRCQGSVYKLMPHRRLLWDSVQALRLNDDLKILSVNDDPSGFGLFLAEKGFQPPAAAPTSDEPFPFESGYFDRVFCADPSLSRSNRIFFINELKRILKPNGLIVFADSRGGPASSLRQAGDHLLRIRNIRGLKRRATAFFRLARTVPMLGLKGLLDARLTGPPFSTAALTDNGLTYTRQLDELGNSIYVSAVKPLAKTDPLVDAFVDFSTKFDLQYPGVAPASERIVNVSLADLQKNAQFFDELAVSYQKIFGASELWAEGAYCDRDSRHLISLEAYNGRLEVGDLKCSCGGAWQPCYSKDYFKQLMTDQLTQDAKHTPVCSLYMADGQVSGFVWGALADVDTAFERVLKTPNWVDKGDWQEFVLQAKSTLLSRFDLGSESRLFYIDDMGVLPQFRKGVDPLMLLARQAFSRAVAGECQRVLCWTSKKAPLFKILRYCAFQEVLSNDEGITFMYCENIVPALKILQRGPRAAVPIMIKNAKLFEGKISDAS